MFLYAAELKHGFHLLDVVFSANIEDKGCTATILYSEFLKFEIMVNGYKNDRRSLLHSPAPCIQRVKGSLKTQQQQQQQ